MARSRDLRISARPLSDPKLRNVMHLCFPLSNEAMISRVLTFSKNSIQAYATTASYAIELPRKSEGFILIRETDRKLATIMAQVSKSAKPFIQNWNNNDG